jgi:hypothetical protein
MRVTPPFLLAREKGGETCERRQRTVAGPEMQTGTVAPVVIRIRHP